VVVGVGVRVVVGVGFFVHLYFSIFLLSVCGEVAPRF